MSFLDRYTALLLKRRFIEAFQQYSKNFQKSCSKEESAASIPVEVGFILSVLNLNEAHNKNL